VGVGFATLAALFPGSEQLELITNFIREYMVH